MPSDINDPRVIHQRKARHIAQIRKNGSFYITDCQPGYIKDGCRRVDCPMRFVAAVAEPSEDSYLLQCNPVGDLADMLILLDRTSVPL